VRVSRCVTPTIVGELATFRTLLGLAVVFLVIALMAAVFGFGFVSSTFMDGAKNFFFIFLVLAVLSFVGGFFYHRYHRQSFWDR
jgi:uncharacterized membrane protein YtjA (UPF0391 family)